MIEKWLEPEGNLSKYQSMPFWSWNDKLEEEQLVAQIDWMKQAGIGGFVMHARGGLQTPYLSDEWMRCIKVSAEKAAESGMQAWIYDENGWPSGFAGGKLLENIQYRAQYLSYSVGSYDSSAWLVYAADESCLRRIHEPYSGECLNVYLHWSPSAVDILNGEVTDRFLEETHEKYAAYFGEKFTQYISGFFTDEPQYYRWQTPYTQMMPQAYQDAYGEDVLDLLGLLFVAKQGYRQFRYRYWYLMQQMMLKNFAQKVYTWCEEHGISLTGHYVEENVLGMQMTCCAGIMPFYEYMHMPGIDWLKRGERSILAIRQVSSAAQQMGKEQILTETFGCCGWDVTPTELRVNADFQYVGGISRMCHHLVPYSERGQRKRDFPAHFSPVNPWVAEYFQEFNDYYTRLSSLLTNTKEIAYVAVLHPIRSAYFEFGYHTIPEGIQEGFRIRELETALREELERLTFAQIPFHMLDETLLERHGFVEDGKIGCGLCRYKCLVIPTCYTMGKYTEHLLHEYVQQGGKVILLGRKPDYLEGEPFDYPYLESNITFDELSETLPYRVERPVERVHSTLRKCADSWFLFVQNYGAEAKTVSYRLIDGSSAFRRWDVADMTSKVVSTDVQLQAGESCILECCKQDISGLAQRKKRTVHLQPDAEVVSATDNFLTLDTACYSKDGIHYSEELPCMGIFQLLLKERYRGSIHLKYRFCVKETPKDISLVVEKSDYLELDMNGHTLNMTENWERDHLFLRGDIHPWVVDGMNELHMKVSFFQNEDVYYALYGEDVSETLRNCLSYDTEIEPVYLAGKFGVYAEKFIPGETQDVLLGTGFYIGKQPKHIKNLITDGFPFFSGKITLKREIVLETKDAVLEFEGRFHALKVRVNGWDAGTMLYQCKNRLDISEYAHAGVNEIIIELLAGNRNLFGPHHYVEEEPKTVTPECFEMPGTWENGRSSNYRDSYAFVPVPLC